MSTLTLDLLFTLALSGSLVALMFAGLAALPWRQEEAAESMEALRAAARLPGLLIRAARHQETQVELPAGLVVVPALTPGHSSVRR